MTKADIVVLGGSAAGITAAITARRHHPDKSILLIRKETKVPIPCGIPYIYGTLTDADKNLIPDAILETNKVDLRVGEATKIDRAGRAVLLGDDRIEYERLILATGSVPTQPPIPGVDMEGVYIILKDVDYLRQLQRKLQDASNVVIIGCGFIGIEFADEINKIKGKNVTILEVAPNCLKLSYDDEFCEEMETHLRGRGITVYTSTAVEQIAGEGRVREVRLNDGTVIPADLVILGIGAKANVALAKEAELRLGLTGGVAVDRTMQTSDPNIFACGDCAEKISFFGGGPSPLKLASIAQLEARIAGANVFGLRRESDGTLGVWSTAVGDLAMGTAGLTESMAKDFGYDVVSGTVETPNRHPGCMPGAAPVKVKLVFERHSRTLLGGQVRGSVSVGELINTIAACVQKRMTAEDIAMFQMGTHPALTASPIAYPLVNAAEVAITRLR
ncbi:MAG: FAD-dependent oxidoreductase [Phycisphaerae bacterium]|nr:FAD-dependent oxidoreductase [Phycisphaerae bacterium]